MHDIFEVLEDALPGIEEKSQTLERDDAKYKYRPYICQMHWSFVLLVTYPPPLKYESKKIVIDFEGTQLKILSTEQKGLKKWRQYSYYARIMAVR